MSKDAPVDAEEKAFWDRLRSMVKTSEGRTELKKALEAADTAFGNPHERPKAQYKIPRSAFYCETERYPDSLVAVSHRFVLSRGIVSADLFGRLDEAIRQACPGVVYCRNAATHTWEVPAARGSTGLYQAVQPFCA